MGDGRLNPRIFRCGVTAAVIFACLAAPTRSEAAPEAALAGTVIDAETGSPIPFVTVTLDSTKAQRSSSMGAFSFENPSPGTHTLTFQHLAYVRRSVSVEWPTTPLPLVVRLQPQELLLKGVEVSGKRVLPLQPTGSVALTPREIVASPGNIANDPLRTIESQPSSAPAGVDFLSRTSVRGGGPEENRVYFDGYPLRQYAHAGGFSSVVYDGMLGDVVLVPGAAPIQYHGVLSGLVLENPMPADSSFASFRYDITSIAGGVSRVLRPTLAVQAAAKTSFFNLPVYQEIGVKSRTFQDLFARAVRRTGPEKSVTATVLAARDAETGTTAGTDRDVGSVLGGVEVLRPFQGWELGVRPYISHFDSRDQVTVQDGDFRHTLDEGAVSVDLERPGTRWGASINAEGGVSRHRGTGGTFQDAPYAASAVLRFKRGDDASLALGAGGSHEPFTRSFAPEAYVSARARLAGIATLSADARRSHQSPFVFSERRSFASVPIDPGDLRRAYLPSPGRAPAVTMDQAGLEASVSLPLRAVLTLDGFVRRYTHLLTWSWGDFPAVEDVRSDGRGHGNGYEMTLAWSDHDRISLMAALSRARVWKREGSLTEERPGDFDRPRSVQVAASIRTSERFRITLRWTSIEGRPYTSYPTRSLPPASSEINASRLPDFRRLDAKVVYTVHAVDYDADFFLDILNLFDRNNIATMYTVESKPGKFASLPYGGTHFFPIVGATLHW